MGIIVSIMVEITKFIKIPAGIIQLIVFLLSLLLAILAHYNTGLYEVFVEAIKTAGVAFGTYEIFIKKLHESNRQG